jgi:hypothetical protein
VDLRRRGDGLPDTLTTSQNVEGNILRGFTGVEWEARKGNKRRRAENSCWKSGMVGRTFIVTIKNEDEVKTTKFELLEGREENAIICDQDWIRDLEWI